MIDPTYYRLGEGERIDAGEGSVIVLKATGEATGGSFFMSETTISPGFRGPPPHKHQRLHDMFYVLEGVLTMRLGEETHEVAAGSFVGVPPGSCIRSATPATPPYGF